MERVPVQPRQCENHLEVLSSWAKARSVFVSWTFAGMPLATLDLATHPLISNFRFPIHRCSIYVFSIAFNISRAGL
jgi:hypothetical protein